MVIHAINVVVIRDGVVDMIYTFRPDDAQAAEAKFVEICTLTAKRRKQDISAADLQTYLEDGYMEVGNGSVCLSHSLRPMGTYDDLREVIQNLLDSADETGCSDDLTVVSKGALERLREWQVGIQQDGTKPPEPKMDGE